MREKQLSLLKNESRKLFGGSRLKSHPKTRRPLASKNAIHLVMKSQMAHGKKSFLHSGNARKIDRIIRKHAAARGVRLYELVNVGNHIHIVMKLNHKSLPAAQRAYRGFVRACTGLIARHVLKAERGCGQDKQFWEARPFTRVLSWGRDFKFVMNYMRRNRSQATAKIIPWGFAVTDPIKIVWLETS